MGKKQNEPLQITFKLSSSELERIRMSALRQAAKERIDAFAKDFPAARRQRVLFALLKFFRRGMRRSTRQQLQTELKEILRKLSPDEIRIFRNFFKRQNPRRT